VSLLCGLEFLPDCNSKSSCRRDSSFTKNSGKTIPRMGRRSQVPIREDSDWMDVTQSPRGYQEYLPEDPEVSIM